MHLTSLRLQKTKKETTTTTKKTDSIAHIFKTASWAQLLLSFLTYSDSYHMQFSLIVLLTNLTQKWNIYIKANFFFRNTFKISSRQIRRKVNLPFSTSLTQKINKFTGLHLTRFADYFLKPTTPNHLLSSVGKYIILDFNYKHLKKITHIICHKCCYWSSNFMVLWCFSCWSQQQKQKPVEKRIQMSMADSSAYTQRGSFKLMLKENLVVK